LLLLPALPAAHADTPAASPEPPGRVAQAIDNTETAVKHTAGKVGHSLKTAAVKTGHAIGRGMDETGHALKQAAHKTGEVLDETGNRIEHAFKKDDG